MTISDLIKYNLKIVHVDTYKSFNFTDTKKGYAFILFKNSTITDLKNLGRYNLKIFDIPNYRMMSNKEHLESLI